MIASSLADDPVRRLSTEEAQEALKRENFFHDQYELDRFRSPADRERATDPAYALPASRHAQPRPVQCSDQIEAGLERLAGGQQSDGGWTFDWLAWWPGQSVEWRGILTVLALSTLHAHQRIELPIRDAPA